MFFKNNRKANDTASFAITIAVLLYVVFMALNISFQAFSKARLATAMDACARYVATHSNSNEWATQCRAIIGFFDDSNLVKIDNRSNINIFVGWNDIQNCIENNACTAPAGPNAFRRPFVIGARFTLRPVAPIPFLKPLSTSVWSIGTFEIFQIN